MEMLAILYVNPDLAIALIILVYVTVTMGSCFGLILQKCSHMYMNPYLGIGGWIILVYVYLLPCYICGR